MDDLSNYRAKSGSLVPVWTSEIQTLHPDVDRILEAVMEVHPLEYGNYKRNASVSGVGWETSQPKSGSTTAKHFKGFKVGGTESYPSVELKISVPRDLRVLERVMDAILYVHQYEEPVIYVREGWASRAVYNPKNDNPNRWWNNGRGLPKKI